MIILYNIVIVKLLLSCGNSFILLCMVNDVYKICVVLDDLILSYCFLLKRYGKFLFCNMFFFEVNNKI